MRAPARQQSMSGVCLASLGRSSSTSGESSSAGMAVLCPRSHTIARGVKPILSATLTLVRDRGTGRIRGRGRGRGWGRGRGRFRVHSPKVHPGQGMGQG